MITIEELKNKIDESGYFATEELIYDTYNALCMFNDNIINSGQDIYAICLEGPPGAGKTEYAKTYRNICNMVFGDKVELVDYQCDSTTGKTELFEDINISAAIKGDSENVNIPGKLIDAIKKVNEGKKVILFIDEYDKAREETDAFLLQFLQSGKINSTQHGDLEIKNEYKSNLQVILCKNDMREELSGPLSRRIRIVRLDYMEPTVFFKIATKNLIEKKEDKVNDGLINFVTLIYDTAYNNKEYFNRLPSCSEMLIAIEDTDRLIKRAQAPKNIVYQMLIKNMFKSADDIKTFESLIQKSKIERDIKLNRLINLMKKNETKEDDINSIIANNIFSNTTKLLNQKIEEVQNLIGAYTTKFQELELKEKEIHKKEVLEVQEDKFENKNNISTNSISLEKGTLLCVDTDNKVVSNYAEGMDFIRKGEDIFVLSNDWFEVGIMNSDELSHSALIQEVLRYASFLKIKIYDNGILLKSENDQNLIVYKDIDNEGKQSYRFMYSTAVLPSTYLSNIERFIALSGIILQGQPLNIDCEKLYPSVKYSINTLLYNDEDYPLLEPVSKGIYSFEFNSFVSEKKTTDNFKNIISQLKCENVDNALNCSKEILAKQKSLSNKQKN